MIRDNVTNGCMAYETSVVYMHDTDKHEATAESLPMIIKTLQNSGYTFSALNKEIKPVIFDYPE